MKFHYQARTKTGEIQVGIVEASNRDSAINLLRAAGLYITFLEEESPPFYTKRIKIFEKVSKKEIVVFSRQLSILFASEIPLIEILQTLAKQTKNPLFREKILEISEKVEGGMPLSEAFNSFPEIFDSFYVNTVRAGEVSGKLSETFSYLADSLEKDYEFSSKIKGALIYPSFVLVIFSLVVTMMVFWILPQTAQTILESGLDVPMITKILLGLGDFLKKWGLFLLLFVVFGIFFIISYIKTKEGRTVFDHFILKIPFLGSVLKRIYLARFALNLSTLLSGGLPIVQSLEITAQVVGNDVYKKIILETAERVKRGERMSEFLEYYPESITPLFVQILAVGEKTGKLTSVLNNIVSFYQKEVEGAVESFARVLEPLLIIILGFVVGLLIFSIIFPLYQVITSAGNF